MNPSRNPFSFFELSLKGLAFSVCALLLLLFSLLAYNSSEAFGEFGFTFFYSNDWAPNWEDIGGTLGALPFVLGTLLTSFLALVFSIPFSLGTSIFLGEYYTKGRFHSLITSLIDLLAGIPSVIYGFWAFFVLVPHIQSIKQNLGYDNNGFGIFTSSVVLSVMIIPYSASITREVMNLVPQGVRNSAYALGATRFEVIKDVVIPYCRSGIIAGFFLSLGRALGETMAVTMVIGNTNLIPANLFATANSMASLLANEFAEASDDIYISALVMIALTLFIITTLVNILGRWVIYRIAGDS
jgi:phosphate transport system permease protein